MLVIFTKFAVLLYRNIMMEVAAALNEDIGQCVELLAEGFVSEMHMPLLEWTAMASNRLRNAYVGVAKVNSKAVGVVVVRTSMCAQQQPMLWSSGLWNYVQDTMILEDALEPNELLVEYIAVAHDARGKGVGSALLRWVEQQAPVILQQQQQQQNDVPSGIPTHQHGAPFVTLWVARDNTPALSLYQRTGYCIVKRTSAGCCAVIMHVVLQWFLGHAVWYKMAKTLPVNSSHNPSHKGGHMYAKEGPPTSSDYIHGGDKECAARNVCCTKHAAGGALWVAAVTVAPMCMAPMCVEPVHMAPMCVEPVHMAPMCMPPMKQDSIPAGRAWCSATTDVRQQQEHTLEQQHTLEQLHQPTLRIRSHRVSLRCSSDGGSGSDCVGTDEKKGGALAAGVTATVITVADRHGVRKRATMGKWDPLQDPYCAMVTS